MIANEIELEPLHDHAAGGAAIAALAPPFLDAVNVDVEVHVGAATLSLGRLLSMKVGAVIGLDRALDAPIDVRVGDHVVARGTLVAVDDQFGVRLTEAVIPGALTPRAAE